MVTESNPMVARFSTFVVAAKEERIMLERRCELQAEDHDVYHIPRLSPGFHESEHDFLGGGFHIERCLQKVATEWCA